MSIKLHSFSDNKKSYPKAVLCRSTPIKQREKDF